MPETGAEISEALTSRTEKVEAQTPTSASKEWLQRNSATLRDVTVATVSGAIAGLAITNNPLLAAGSALLSAGAAWLHGRGGHER